MRRRLKKEIKGRNCGFNKSVEIGCFGVDRELD
jgi:hypothetical protein